MWLVYLRFEDQGKVDTYHVRTNNKKGVAHLFELAEQRGLTATSRLVEYATFYARGTIKAKEMPNFHYYEHHEFEERWRETG